LAAEFHSYYNAEQFLVDDIVLRQGAPALVVATGQVVRNGLAVLGVSAGKNVDRRKQHERPRSTAIHRCGTPSTMREFFRHLCGSGTGAAVAAATRIFW
jgi:hypothetical protein